MIDFFLPLWYYNLTVYAGMTIRSLKGIPMGKVLDDRLVYEILSVVSEIPYGKVASYGQIAKLIGREKNSRLVGKVLSQSERYGDYPCHRVVNHAGRLVPGWQEQRMLLESENVVVGPDNHVDMKQFQWNGD